MRKLEEHPWWDELVSLKDTLSLRELAERFDVTPGAISAAMKRLGISRLSAPPGPRARRRNRGDEDDDGMGLPPDVSEASSSAPVLDAFEDLYGSVPDEEIASIAGVSAAEVTRSRLARKAEVKPPVEVARPPEPTPPAKPVASAPAPPCCEKPIAVVSSKEMDSWSRQHQGLVWCYRVHTGEKSYLIVAADLLEAASMAVAAHLPDIHRIDLVGPAL